MNPNRCGRTPRPDRPLRARHFSWAQRHRQRHRRRPRTQPGHADHGAAIDHTSSSDRGIDKGGKELGHLGETWPARQDQAARKQGMLAVQIAAGDVSDANGAGPQRSRHEAAKLNAQKMIAANEAAQAQRRWALEQQSVGTRAEQVRASTEPVERQKQAQLQDLRPRAFKNAAELGSDKNASQQVVLGAPRRGQALQPCSSSRRARVSRRDAQHPQQSCAHGGPRPQEDERAGKRRWTRPRRRSSSPGKKARREHVEDPGMGVAKVGRRGPLAKIYGSPWR